MASLLCGYLCDFKGDLTLRSLYPRCNTSHICMFISGKNMYDYSWMHKDY